MSEFNEIGALKLLADHLARREQIRAKLTRIKNNIAADPSYLEKRAVTTGTTVEHMQQLVKEAETKLAGLDGKIADLRNTLWIIGTISDANADKYVSLSRLVHSAVMAFTNEVKMDVVNNPSSKRLLREAAAKAGVDAHMLAKKAANLDQYSAIALAEFKKHIKLLRVLKG